MKTEQSSGFEGLPENSVSNFEEPKDLPPFAAEIKSAMEGESGCDLLKRFLSTEVLSDSKKVEKLDLILNSIGETPRSLFLAENEGAAAIESLRELLVSEIDKEAEKKRRNELKDILG